MDDRFHSSWIDLLECKYINIVENGKGMLTAPGIPRRSPIQVLTGPDVA